MPACMIIPGTVTKVDGLLTLLHYHSFDILRFDSGVCMPNFEIVRGSLISQQNQQVNLFYTSHICSMVYLSGIAVRERRPTIFHLM